MKTIIFLILISLTSLVQAQYSYTIPNPNYSRKDAIITASTIGATFLTLEFRGNQMSYSQRSITAFTGIGLSLGYSLFQSTDLSRKIQRRIKLNRNKKINEKTNYLICNSNP